jgi:cytochrome c-type biogenesis protein CcmH/NrfG
VRRTLAAAWFGDGNLTGASREAEAAVRLLPRDAGARMLLGRVRAVQGRLAEAIQQFELALEADPSSDEARALIRRLEGPPRGLL